MQKSKAPNKTTRSSEGRCLLKKCLMGSTLLEMYGYPVNRELETDVWIRIYNSFENMREWLLVLSAVALFSAYSLVHAAESVRYSPVPREVVEARLKKF